MDALLRYTLTRRHDFFLICGTMRKRLCSLLLSKEGQSCAKKKGQAVLNQTMHCAKVSKPSSRDWPSSAKMRCRTTSRSPIHHTWSSCMCGGPPSWSSKEQYVELPCSPPTTFSVQIRRASTDDAAHTSHKSFRFLRFVRDLTLHVFVEASTSSFFLPTQLRKQPRALPDLLEHTFFASSRTQGAVHGLTPHPDLLHRTASGTTRPSQNRPEEVLPKLRLPSSRD